MKQISPEDRTMAIHLFRQTLQSLGIDPSIPHLMDTPRRWVDAFIEMTTPHEFSFTTFDLEPSDGGQYGDTGIVLVKDIPFTSICAHHLAPFSGVGTIAYIPSHRIVGLSKLSRLLSYYSSGLQVQETLGQQVADELVSCLQPKGVAVILKARHSCMEMRGAKAHGAETVTSCLRGAFYSETEARAELFALMSH